MAKWGTYFIVGALLGMLLPFFFMMFDAFEISENPIFPVLSLFLGGTGVVLHLLNAVNSKTINSSSLLLLTSILSIIYGFSLNVLGVPNAKYLLLVGALLVAVWIMLPGSKKED
ncbi:hypothetical protein [Brumimicrobium sp.]|uniref:hypothetical protein n=1 Tax=Brumimicrobium sp. TaxID=2029867 RepID=UPI002621533A|nr:hypothetical protein [uncultured Brumimicrobium sp.]